MPTQTRDTLRLAGPALVALALLAGCAGPSKLAQRSQEQLLEGNPAEAYETALKAARKDASLPEVRAALQAAGDAMLALDADRFRALLPQDTLAAAEVALEMAERRYEMATYGVAATASAELAVIESEARQAAARRFGAEADLALAGDDPKQAYFLLAEAARFEPDNPATDGRLREVHAQATDHILVLPFTNQTRYALSAEALDAASRSELGRALEKRDLIFTELVDGGGYAAPNVEMREDAVRAARRAGASRVAWGRVYGDRIDTHVSIELETIYRKTTVIGPDGTAAESWTAHQLVVTTYDRWASVLVDCEVWDVADGRTVARRQDERTVGVRTVATASTLSGEARQYVLNPPEREKSDPSACRAREKEWRSRYGHLTVAQFAEHCQKQSGVATLGSGSDYGEITVSERSLRLYYGHMPSESALLSHVLSDSWRLVADALEEADRL